MRIIIVDDDPLVRDSLQRILESKGIDVIATAENGEQAFCLYQLHHPDLVLMDIRMDNMNGLDATRCILQFDSNAKILLITTFQDEEYIRQAVELGCNGYILKQNISGILPAIEAVASDHLVFDSRIVNKLTTGKKKALPEDLSSREKDILTLVAEGFNNKEIADQLFLSEGTVRNYISTLLDKLELRDRTQLAIYYYKE